MRSPIWLSIVLLIALTACNSARQAAPATSAAKSEPASVAKSSEGQAVAFTHAVQDANTPQREQLQQVSLTDAADTAASTAETADRKIIRNANLTIDVSSTTEAQHRVTTMAESHGGFVVTSESKQREDADPARRTLDIKLVVRIPATHFGAALDEIRGLANNVREENVTGQDVTEEFIDLEARIKTQRALELQFLEIMKQAKKVED